MPAGTCGADDRTSKQYYYGYRKPGITRARLGLTLNAYLGKNRKHRYGGYNKELVDRFVAMGFDVEKIVEAFLYFGIDRNGGNDYELEEAYMGDITARLLGDE